MRMRTQKELLSRFADSPFVAKVQVWTPQRSRLDADGPYDDVAGRLLTMVAANAHPTGKERKAMEQCLKVLTKGK